MKWMRIGALAVVLTAVATTLAPAARSDVSAVYSLVGSVGGTTAAGEWLSMYWSQHRAAFVCCYEEGDGAYVLDDVWLTVGSKQVHASGSPTMVVHNRITDTYRIQFDQPDCSVDITVGPPNRVWDEQSNVAFAVQRDMGGWVTVRTSPAGISNGGTGNNRYWPYLVSTYWKDDSGRLANGTVCGSVVTNQRGSLRQSASVSAY